MEREEGKSNPHLQFGRLPCFLYTTPAYISSTSHLCQVSMLSKWCPSLDSHQEPLRSEWSASALGYWGIGDNLGRPRVPDHLALTLSGYPARLSASNAPRAFMAARVVIKWSGIGVTLPFSLIGNQAHCFYANPANGWRGRLRTCSRPLQRRVLDQLSCSPMEWLRGQDSNLRLSGFKAQLPTD